MRGIKSMPCLICFMAGASSAFARTEPPTLQEVKQQTAAVRKRFAECVVEYRWQVSDRKPGQQRVFASDFLYRNEYSDAGRLAERWQLGPANTTKSNALSHYYFTFDGSRSMMVQLADMGAGKRIGQETVNILPGLDRRITEYTWSVDYRQVLLREWNFQPVDEEIADTEWKSKITGVEEIEGVSVVVVEFEQPTPDTGGVLLRRKHFLDPLRSWMTVRADFFRKDTNTEWTRIETKLASDFRLIDDVWVPFRIEIRDPDKPDPPFQTWLTVSNFEFGDANIRRELVARPYKGPASIRDDVEGVVYGLDATGARESQATTSQADARLSSAAREYEKNATDQRVAAQKIESDRASRRSTGSSLWYSVSGGVAITALASGFVFWYYRRRSMT